MADDENQFTALKALIKESKYFDANDNLLHAILQRGLDGLNEFQEDMGKKNFDNLKSSLSKLLDSQTNSMTEYKKKMTSLKALIKESKYFDDNEYLLNAILEKGLKGLDDFEEDMGKTNFENLKSSVSRLLCSNSNCISLKIVKKHEQSVEDITLSSIKVRCNQQLNIHQIFKNQFEILNVPKNLTTQIQEKISSVMFDIIKNNNGDLEEQDILDMFYKPLSFNDIKDFKNIRSCFEKLWKPLIINEKFKTDLLNRIILSCSKALQKFKNNMSEELFEKFMNLINDTQTNSIQSCEGKAGGDFSSLDADKINSQQCSQSYCREIIKELEKQKEQLKMMPDCLEKRILKLIYLIKLKVLRNNNITHFLMEEKEPMNFDCDILSINDMLLIEGTNLKNKTSECWIKAKSLIKEGDFISAIECLQVMFKQIQPLNIREMIFLLKESQKTYGLIENQDIILLLGMTGSGKTACVHFFSGSKMIKYKNEIGPGVFVDHIAAEEPIQNDLSKFVISCQACSETKHINPIQINLKDVNGNFITLCDSPGFSDTTGPEVDIVNSINTTEVISNCKSVRPVILMSCENQGGRSEGIVEMVGMIQGMMMNIKDHLPAFTYLFTKYPDADVHSKLYNISINIDKHRYAMSKYEYSEYKSFKLVLDDMLTKTKSYGKPLDLINDKPLDILRKILSTPCINNPRQVFKYTINEQSKNALYKQVYYNISAIKCAVMNNKYTLVIYKIDELIFLCDTLRLNDLKEILKETIEFVRAHIQKFYDDAMEKLNSCLDNNNKVTYGDLAFYFSEIEKFKCLNDFKHVEQLESISELSNALLQNLHLKCKEELEKFKSLGIYENDDLKLILNNLKIMSEMCNNDYYSNACQFIHNQVKQIKANFESSLDINDFNTSAKQLLLFKNMFMKFSGYKGLEMLVTTNKTVKYLVTLKLKNLSESCDNLFAQKGLTDQDFSCINNSLQNLKNAKDNKLLCRLFSKKEIEKYYKVFLIKIVQFFENLNNEIKNFLEKQKFKEMEQIYKQIQLVRQIQYVKQNTTSLYHSTVEKIKISVQKLFDDTKKLLENMNNGIIDYNILFSNLNYLKDAMWINVNKYESYEDVIQVVQSKLTSKAHNLYEIIYTTNLELSNYSNLEKIDKVLQQLNELKQFQNIVPAFQTECDQAFKHVENLVEESLAEIKRIFYLEKHSVKKKKIKLMGFKIERLIKQSNLLQLGLGSIEKTEEEIIKIIKSIIDISKNIEQLKIEQEPYASVLSEINPKDNKPIKLKKLQTSNNIQSIDELYSKYNENKSKISNAEINIDQNKHQNDDLEIIKLKINEILSRGLAFEELNEYITKSKHYNTTSLNSKITELEKKINFAELNGLEFIFKSILYTTAENVLNYLDLCLSLKHFNKEVTSYKKEVETFLIKYKEFIIFEMNIFLKQIQSLTAANSFLAHNLAQKIKFQLDECVTIQNFKLLNKLMQCQRIKKDMTDKLLKYHTSLNQPGDENLKTEMFQAFIQFEKYSENVSYCQFYNDYLKNKEIEFNDFEKKILKFIENYKYVMAAMKLKEIDEKVLKPNTVNNIKLNLSKSINNVINTTKQYLKTIENNLDEKEFKYIAKQLLILNNAKMHLYNDHSLQEKYKLNSYIDEKTDLINTFKFIENEVNRKVKKYAESINLSIINDDFYEAELKINHLKSICKLLTNYCNIDEINSVIQTTQKNIEDRLDLVTEKYENLQMNDFFQNIPKKIINKIDKFVKLKNDKKYEESLSKFKKTIANKIIQALCKIKEVRLGERSVMMEHIKSILTLMPTDIEIYLKSEWQKVQNDINQEYEEFKNECNQIKYTSDVNLINKLLKKCKRNGLNSFIGSIQSTIITQFNECNHNLSKYLEENDVGNGLLEFRKCLQYMQIFGKKLVELNNIFRTMESSLRDKFNNICLTLSDISSNSEVEYTITCFNNLNLFIKLKTEYQNMSSLSNLINYAVNGQVRPYENIADFFIKIQLNCQNSLKELNITKINESMNASKKWNNLLVSAKKYYRKNADTEKISEILPKIESCVLYDEWVKTFSTILKTYKVEIFNFKLVKSYKIDQEHFYSDFVKSVSFLHHSKKLSIHIDDSIFKPSSYENEIFPILNNYFQKVVESTKNFFCEDNSDKTKQEFDIFRFNLKNIKLFETHFKSVGINFNLSSVENEIVEKLKQTLNYYFEMIDKADSDICKKAKWLIKIKTFAINLPEYTEYINNRLNTFFKDYYKKKKDRKTELPKLAIALEQDPNNVGFNIISEHSVFKGKIVSNFNKNANRTIDYVLNALQGNYINDESIQQLRGFYDVFSNDYTDVVKEYLNQKGNKNGFNKLIKLIKLDGEKVFRNIFERKGWKKNHKKKLCQLVAKIFALWTLQNTEYYNELDGLEKCKSYLMKPHPSQVISVFCILGLDIIEGTYTINKVFQNSLVQVGTGEGKSLILAVVSCVLSLIGFDVSCACYSNCLSSRDYKSFFKLFSSLSLTSHIKYATFFSICEDIMNQNFNIRKHVSDLVFNKLNTKVCSQKKKARPDILLIDEVDVFFNKTFYGQLYNQVVTIKHSSINDLTSYIWSERYKRPTLEQVKLTTEYQKCCKFFEGWEFIVTEAVKQMLFDVINFKVKMALTVWYCERAI
nr:reticulocyte-binding protein homolog 1 [Hydra vulgaris]